MSKMSYNAVIDDMKALYSSIDVCIDALVRGRVEKDEKAVAYAHRRMESLMVATKQELRVIADYLTQKGLDLPIRHENKIMVPYRLKTKVIGV